MLVSQLLRNHVTLHYQHLRNWFPCSLFHYSTKPSTLGFVMLGVKTWEPYFCCTSWLHVRLGQKQMLEADCKDGQRRNSVLLASCFCECHPAAVLSHGNSWTQFVVLPVQWKKLHQTPSETPDQPAGAPSPEAWVPTWCTSSEFRDVSIRGVVYLLLKGLNFGCICPILQACKF